MRTTFFLFLILLLISPLLAQPKKDLPVINPNNAKFLRMADKLGSPVTCIAVHPVSGLVVAGCEDGELRRWSRVEGKGLLEDAKAQPLKAHGSAVTAVACAPGLTVSASSDGKVAFWNFPDEKPVQTVSPGAAVRAVAVTDDAKMVASVGDDSAVQLWDGAGKAVRKLAGPTDWLQAVAFSADGKFVAAGGHDGKLWLWEVASGRKVFDVASAGPPPNKKDEAVVNIVTALAFAPDGKIIALGGEDGKIYLYQTADGKLARTMAGHTHTVTGLVYHPANGVLVSSSKDRTVRLWNAAGNNPIKLLEGHTAWASGVALAEKGTLAVSVSADRSVRVWDLGAVAVKPSNVKPSNVKPKK